MNNSNTTIDNCSVIELPKIGDRNGIITSINELEEIPFKVKRVFYLYDIPGGESRGAHSHKECHQFLIAATGSFDVKLNDGGNHQIVSLNRPNFGLHIPPGIWASEENFSSSSICLVITNQVFDENDYIRDFTDFLNFKGI